MGENYDYVKVPREILESMGKIVDYCWNNERKHFEEHFNVEMIEDDKFVNSESGEEFDISKTDHIFKHIKIVNDYLTETEGETEEYKKELKRYGEALDEAIDIFQE